MTKKPVKALRSIALSPKQAASVVSSLSPQQAALLSAAVGNARKPESMPPTEGEAATAIARAWLAEVGFHEDPTGKDPNRIEIQCSGWEGRTHEHYVDVRVYIPAIDIEGVIDGTSDILVKSP
jgi:hypothetical protein